jgi:hypothetical protein
MSGTKNKMEDLRNHLFTALERLNDAASTNEMHMDRELDRAKAICEVAQVIVNSAKVEVEFIKATDRERGSEFLEPKKDPQLAQGAATMKGLSTGRNLGREPEVLSRTDGNGRKHA